MRVSTRRFSRSTSIEFCMILLEVLYSNKTVSGYSSTIDHLLCKLAEDGYDRLGVPSSVRKCSRRRKITAKDIPSD